MTAKEKIVGLIQDQGYDLITACELAEDCLQDFQKSGKKQQNYYIGKTEITLTAR